MSDRNTTDAFSVEPGDVDDLGATLGALPSGLTLDPDRTWLDVTCSGCGRAAKVNNGAGNTVSRPATVMATLPDGSEVEVQVQEEVPAPTLRWECGGCRLVQETDIEGSEA